MIRAKLVFSRLLLAFLTFGSCSLLKGAYVTTQIGGGTYTLGANSTNELLNLSTPVSINRLAAGYGTHTTVPEGVWASYSFTVPENTLFDLQHEFEGVWSGWGSADNGPWQNGPTTSSWSRGTRYQHRYPGGTPTSTVNPVGGLPSPDLNVPLNTTLSQPSAGDELRLNVYFDTVLNRTYSEYMNLTTGESFAYMFEDYHPGMGNTLTFNNIRFRSDTVGLKQFEYAYGTFVVPEPDKILLLSVCVLALSQSRRRKA